MSVNKRTTNGAAWIVAALVLTISVVLGGLEMTLAQESEAAKKDDGAAGNTRRKLPTPIASTHELMETINRPYYKQLQETMAKQPAAEAGWNDIAARGLQAAEIANLVAIREVEQREQWLNLAANLQQAGTELREVAKTHDWQAARQAYRGVLNACNTCHHTRAPEEAPQLKP